MRWSGQLVERERRARQAATRAPDTNGAKGAKGAKGQARVGWSRARLVLTFASGLFLAGAAASCGVPEHVSYWYDEPAPECTTVADCNDDNKCTTDKCVDSVCVNTAVNPDDGNVCTTDACDPALGVTHGFVPVDDKNACTADVCDPVSGVSHTPVNPSDGDGCTIDVCDPASGIQHTPVNIDDGDGCTIDSCDAATGVLSHVPVAVDDNDVCTIDACDPATGAVAHTPVVVDDSNACTTDVCDPVAGVSHTPLPPCGQQVPESCSFVLCDKADGVCKPYDTAFSDDFANNNAGWLLDMQWQIGGAAASSGQGSGNPDPSQDYNGSGADDNGVAGVMIGGNAAPTNGSTVYLTSPAIDLSSLPAGETVFLDFWRYLNTAPPLTMQSNIEVWNGDAWVQIWTNAAAIYDPTWQNLYYDVTSHKNAQFRVRFGLKVNNGAPVVSSWNIDHVRLIRKSDQGC